MRASKHARRAGQTLPDMERRPMVRESRSLWQRAVSAPQSTSFHARYALSVSALAIAAAILLAAAHAQPAPSVAKGTLAQGAWTKLAPMLHPQNEAVVAVLGSRIYVMGGFAPGVEG